MDEVVLSGHLLQSLLAILVAARLWVNLVGAATPAAKGEYDDRGGIDGQGWDYVRVRVGGHGGLGLAGQPS